jgi:aspartyl-tRNA synthetase
MIDNYTDHADEKKTRKSLLAVAITTIFLGNMEISSSTLTIFGLELVFDQDRLMAFGQIATSVLLVIFIFRSLPIYIASLHKISLNRLSQKENVTKKEWRVSWDVDVPAESKDGPDGEYQAIHHKFEYLRNQADQKFSTLIAIATAIAVVFVDFGVPLCIGFIAAVEPIIISDLVDEMTNETSP